MKNTTPAPSYVGEEIFIGIDVHKKTYSVVARVHQSVVKKWTTAADPASLCEQLHKFFPAGDLHSAYEAGFSGFALHRQLVSAGINNRVVHAANVEVAIHNRVKTDSRDAAKLSELLEAKRLQGIRVPSPEQEQKRLLSRTRAQLVEERSALKQKIWMKAHQFGLVKADETRRMSHKVFKALLAAATGEALKITLNVLHTLWQTLDQQIAHLNQQLRRQAEADELEARYRSVPGVGPLSARVLSNELGDFSDFANERVLASYIGLTPSEQSSGERIRRGHITKQGNCHVRGLLIEVAWRAIRKDDSLRAVFARLKVRTGAKKAIVAIARKLLGRMRAIFRTQQTYQLNYDQAQTV